MLCKFLCQYLTFNPQAALLKSMPDPKLLAYIKEEQQKGFDKTAITTSLLTIGWQQAQIDEAFASFSPQAPTSTPESNRFPTFIELLKQAWRIYKNKWKALMGIILVPALIAVLSALPIIIFSAIMGFTATTKSNHSFPPIILVLGVVYIAIFGLLIVALQVWSQVSLLVAIRDRVEKIGTEEAYSRSKKFILKNFLLGIVVFLIIAIGYILFVIPGVIFGIWVGFAYCVLVTEDTGVMESIKRSKEYTSGRLTEIFYRTFLLSIFTIVVSVVLSIIPVVNILSGIVNVFIFGPLSLIFTFLIYESLKNLKGKTISNPTSKLKFLSLIILPFILGGIFIVLIAMGAMSAFQNSAKNKASFQITNIKQLPAGSITPSPQPEGAVQTFPTQTDNQQATGTAQTQEITPAYEATTSASNFPTKGNPNAKVTIVEFADFRCPFSDQFFKNTEPQLLKDYVNTGKVKFVFRNFAFLGPASTVAADAADCANDQGKFWEFHDYLYQNQPASQSDTGIYSTDALTQAAASLNLDYAAFRACLSNRVDEPKVTADLADGEKMGVTGTPSFFINKTLIVGAVPYSTIKAAIDQALAAP